MDKRGGVITIFCRKAFVSLYQNISLENTLDFQKNSLSKKIFMHRKGGHHNLSKIFASQYRNEKLCKGTLLFSRKFRVSKNFMPKRGISRFSIEILVSHSTYKLRMETLLCFTKLLVSENFMNKRGGGVSRFSVEYFCLKVPKSS